jgi:hypothetical protein
MFPREFNTKRQTLRSYHDRVCRKRLLLRLKAPQSALGLAVQPRLRDEDREQSEDYCKRDHHDCGFSHDDLPETPARCLRPLSRFTIAMRSYGISEAFSASPAMLKIG